MKKANIAVAAVAVLVSSMAVGKVSLHRYQASHGSPMVHVCMVSAAEESQPASNEDMSCPASTSGYDL